MIHSTLTKTQSRRKYPYLGIAENGRVVLFTEPSTGVCIRGIDEGDDSVGNIEGVWAERQFVPLEGSITLENSE